MRGIGQLEVRMTVTALYTAHAAATGGRDGHTRSSDGVIDVDLSVPKELGGQGGPARPLQKGCSPLVIPRASAAPAIFLLADSTFVPSR
jgi:hypothetical protein